MMWAFLCCLLFFSCCLPEAKIPRKASILSIGISYEGTDAQKLEGTINDATELHAAFSQRYPQATALLLCDRMATKAHVQAALSSMTGQELLIISYSGHGTQNGSWVLCDPEGTQFEDGKVKEANLLSPEDLWALLSPYPGPVLVISDSCYSGNLLPASAAISSANDKDGDLSLGMVEERRYALSCTTRDNTGKEDRNAHRHGYFTRALLDELGWDHEQSTLSGQDQAISLDSLYEGVLRRQRIALDGNPRTSQRPVVSPGPWELWL